MHFADMNDALCNTSSFYYSLATAYVHSIVGSICGAYLVTNFNANATDAGFLPARVGQEDVLGFEVSVDDTLAVEDTHGCCYLLEKDPQSVLPQSALSWNNREALLLRKPFTHTLQHPHPLALTADETRVSATATDDTHKYNL